MSINEDEELSEYEKQRLENIKRNNEYLKSIGIDQAKTIPFEAVTSQHHKEKVGNKNNNVQRKKDEKKKKNEYIKPTRSSNRIRGTKVEHIALNNNFIWKKEKTPVQDTKVIKTMLMEPSTLNENEKTYLICVPDEKTGRPRVRILTSGYSHTANCRFPRDIRKIGRIFSAPSKGIYTGYSHNGVGYYIVNNPISIETDVVDPEKLINQQILADEMQNLDADNNKIEEKSDPVKIETIYSKETIKLDPIENKNIEEDVQSNHRFKFRSRAKRDNSNNTFSIKKEKNIDT